MPIGRAIVTVTRVLTSVDATCAFAGSGASSLLSPPNKPPRKARGRPASAREARRAARRGTRGIARSGFVAAAADDASDIACAEWNDVRRARAACDDDDDADRSDADKELLLLPAGRAPQAW
jgi:alkanesulfonate monooxygenase SsuD/methylene tetrahydromethanopterin reductase-like flavin-dependent oxidoreductase (luciferase family)